MPTIDLNEKIKEDLKKIKEAYGCKTYSEAVALLMRSNTIEDILNLYFGRIMGQIAMLSKSIDDVKKKPSQDNNITTLK